MNKHVEITEEVEGYIDGLLVGGERVDIEDVRAETLAIPHSNMQTRMSQMRFVAGIMKAINARRVIEIGTLRGYGAARMAQALPEGGKLIVLEKDPRYVDELNERWSSLGLAQKIELRTTRASEGLDALLAENLEKFDLIFIDADKENYKTYVEKSMELLRERGVILVDNTLWGGKVAHLAEDNGTIHVQEFNTWVFEMYKDSASIIPAWDGMTMIVKS